MFRIKYETEKEILRIQEENEANLIQENNQSQKKCDTWKQTFKNDLYITDQLNRKMRLRMNKRLLQKKKIKDKILLVQRKTAERIMRATERKIRLEYDSFVYKQKRIKLKIFEELEKLLKDKNEYIVEKEAKINQLFQKFEEQEKKFASLLKQIDNYKVTQQLEVCITIVSKYGKKSDIEIQVSMLDPRVELFEFKLSEMIQQKDEIKEELKLLHKSFGRQDQKFKLTKIKIRSFIIINLN
ncbi:unnamed protein product [Paramecium primaurelia]|uniref:Uncharacterized protein n=1 Tax=Paramecium primaurelia TaxID=5886 RepID=A0A8S1KLG4_PARPR|nr:unnamed protein product [Paramecium primaurelia]